MNNSNKHFLIIGQGISGSILADRFMKANQKVHILDRATSSSPSKIAAGIINPITGRRFVLSWMIDELIPVASDYYKEIEKEHEVSIIQRKIILRAFHSIQEENDWDGRCLEESYQRHIAPNTSEMSYAGSIHSSSAIGSIQGYQINIPLLIQTFEKYFLEKKVLQNSTFNYEKLEIHSSHFSYENENYDAVIFCEGWHGEHNPFFKYLPFNRSKGEILLIEIPDSNFLEIIKNGIFIAPLGENKYWVGASNKWHTEDENPSEEKRLELIEKLEKIIHVPYKIIEHKAAIRPTVRDRRPFLGEHPEIKNMFIFNGMGTKGASLAPYWSKQMINFIFGHSDLPKEVNISRYAP